MKKVISLFLSVVFFTLLITGCSSDENNSETSVKVNTISPTISDDTALIQPYISRKVAFFNFSVDESFTSYEVKGYQYIDNSWQLFGSLTNDIQNYNTSLRKAIEINENGFSIYNLNDETSTLMEYSSDDLSLPSFTGTEHSSMQNNRSDEIILNEEIFLYVAAKDLAVVGTTNPTLDDNFKDLEPSSGVAFTITFLSE